MFLAGILNMPKPDHFFSAIIVAGGLGTRFSPVENKTTKHLFGIPVLEYSLDAFENSDSVSEIVLVGDGGMRLDSLQKRYSKVGSIVPGGNTRTHSVKNGLEAINPSTRFIFIHDAARPLLEAAFIDQMAELILSHENITGIFPALPLYDSLKSINNQCCTPLQFDQVFIRTQTPQLFHTSSLKEAFNHNPSLTPFRDEVEMIHHFSKSSTFLPIPGSYQLEKITTLQEWHLLECLAEKEERIGIGYDFHPFQSGRTLILGGVVIPDFTGLEGDSDGDVYTHSILEALLGALSLGDMGSFFGIGTKEVMNKKSITFLQELLEHEALRGVQIQHIDTTIVAKEPKMNPWIREIKKNIAPILSISENQINIKSTTDKGMDAAGEGIGIRSISVVLVHKMRRNHARRTA